ncbi:fosfomycin resistance glutathione transferase [Pseudoduganella chitinolytica]|uniref:Fosfomycin resistance glutathione transferase n=1 Tax=Pseudoduganella chitinolytica TaxID=34070 RepID=A0ABY8BH84_9BURK|nr:fosfomycin resistance glutathione transferase [Pseudoduganella chitinolytica]WEF33739.1 fosfomycin resistance glutathione transferase [Pseudoduganella chitinolytica]
MLSGLNHLTLAVLDLHRSVDFYRTLLGFRLHATWRAGAYLSLGDLWLCLSLDASRSSQPAPDYTHYAFSVAADQFDAFVARLLDHSVVEWKTNRSEGKSFYFLDPDGHKLEVHVGDLASRLSQCRLAPYDGMRLFD